MLEAFLIAYAIAAGIFIYKALKGTDPSSSMIAIVVALSFVWWIVTLVYLFDNGNVA